MNSFGRIFRVSLFGESHGEGVGALIDGCPPGLDIEPGCFLADLDRRSPKGKSNTERLELSPPKILSGVYRGKTTGAPLMLFLPNTDVDSSTYSYENHPRPGHADLTQQIKSKGYADLRGGGVSSGRLTAAIVAAGVVAKKLISPVEITSRVLSVKGSTEIEREALAAANAGDSVGGVVECRVAGLSVGLGEPFFDGVESVVAHLAMSVPGARGIEFGSGFEAANRFGSEENDLIINENGSTATNNSGGVNGGISNGNELVFRIAFKPASSVAKPQMTFNFTVCQIEELIIKGRHDACYVLRIPPVIEALTAIALADLVLIAK